MSIRHTTASSKDRWSAVVPAVLAAAAVALLLPMPAAARVLEHVQTAEGSRLPGLERVVLSPDGRHLYVGGRQGVNVFARRASGSLRFVERHETLRDEDFILSPDGRHLYVYELGVLTIFERDSRSGRLRLAGRPDLSFDWIGTALAISPDGRHVYTKSARAAVHVLERDAATGDVREAGELDWSDELRSLASLAVSPDGRHVYAVNVTQLAVLGRHPESGAVSFIELQVDGLPSVGITSLSISPDGRHVYVTVYGGRNAIRVFERDPVRDTLRHVDAPFDDGGLLFFGALSAVVSPAGDRVYLAAERRNAVVAFDRDRASGVLSFAAAVVDGESGARGLNRVQAVAVSPAGRHLYAAGAGDGAVVRLSSGGAGAGLAFVEARFSGDDGIAGLGDAGAAVTSPDGEHVYAGGFSQVTALARDGESGALSYLMSSTETGFPFATQLGVDLAMSPLGEHLYVARGRAGQLIGSLTVFARDPRSGTFGPIQAASDLDEGFERLRGANSVSVSPDGRHVYVGAGASLLTLSRNAAAGTVDPVAFVRLGSSSKEEVEVATSPDGRHVYAAATVAATLAALARDADTGRLEVVAVYNLLDDSPGLTAAGDVAVSPDGRHIYVASSVDGALTVFARDPRSGELASVETYFDGEDGVDGLAGASDVAVGPDGQAVYVSSFLDDSLAVFGRDPRSGRLELLEVHRDERLGVDGLAFAGSVTVSPDGRNVYVTSQPESAVTVFRRQRGPCVDSPQTVCLAADRFRVEVEWLDFEGRQGAGRAVPHGSGDSGLLWFFDADNWELLVKVLDGCAINQRYWVYAAATTDVGYTLRVTDTLTGAVRTYSNPLGNAAPAVTDSDAFATCAVVRRSAAPGRRTALVRSDPEMSLGRSAGRLAGSETGSPAACRDSLARLCLDDGRFQAEVEWRDFAGRTGFGRALSFGSGDSGLFWFFDERNWELLVKVLDGCDRNDRYWVLAAGTTDVHYRLWVTDTSTGVVREYENALGTAAAAVTDTDAFATCR